jgi:hypothetical protein
MKHLTKPRAEQRKRFEPRHAVREARRLHALAQTGESAATPLIETALVALLVVPLALLVIGIADVVFYAAG